MVTNRPKKNRAMRGSRTHGWGSPKKHRGKGSRGGVGKSGMGKRGQHKMSLLNSLGIKNLGSHGFTRPRQETFVEHAINLGAIEANTDKWLGKKIAVEEKGMIVVDMEKLGFTKVLGGGKLSRKMIITADKFSAGAKEKIISQGSKLFQTSSEKPKAERKDFEQSSKIEASGGKVEEALRQEVSRKPDAEEGEIVKEEKEMPKAEKAAPKTEAKADDKKAPKEKAAKPKKAEK